MTIETLFTVLASIGYALTDVRTMTCRIETPVEFGGMLEITITITALQDVTYVGSQERYFFEGELDEDIRYSELEYGNRIDALTQILADELYIK